MNTEELIADARWMIDTIEQCNSSAFKAAAARQLVGIAVEISAQYYVPATTAQPEPSQTEPAPIDHTEVHVDTRGCNVTW